MREALVDLADRYEAIARARESLFDGFDFLPLITGQAEKGPREFYEKACGGIEIPGSDPGIYADVLPEPE